VQKRNSEGVVTVAARQNPTVRLAVADVATRMLVYGVLILFGAVIPAAAVQHPVPLDPKTDSATCITCHEDKTKGKSVHSAIAMGCLSCHEVRANKESTHVKLITATPYKLCLTCHTDKDASHIQGRVHPPAVRDCLKCHDPHTSDYKNQLLKPTSGDAKENLCLSCHQMGLNVPAGGSRHAALDMGCDTCHITHKTGDPSKIEFRYHLVKSTPQLCLDCHDANDAALQKSHQGQPFATANCVECHDPHQSKQPKLMQAFLHNPFENKMCDTCHQPAKDGKVVLAAADAKTLCLMCHDDKGKQIDNAKVPHPGAAGDCTDCHSPHASKSPGLPKSDPVSICLDCHSDIADLQKKAVHHQPAFVQGCATCHEPHGGDRENLLRASGNALCLECHGPDRQPQTLKADHLITIFNGQVKLPEDYFTKNKVIILPLRYGLGHPVQYHPVSDVMDPTNINKVKFHLSCLSCHQPHASAKPDLLVKDQENNMAFCDTCHKNRITMGVR
jgi:predicted CXXCH cytochrome family protein